MAYLLVASPLLDKNTKTARSLYPAGCSPCSGRADLHGILCGECIPSRNGEHECIWFGKEVGVVTVFERVAERLSVCPMSVPSGKNTEVQKPIIPIN